MDTLANFFRTKKKIVGEKEYEDANAYDEVY